MGSHTVPAVSRSVWTPEARTGQRVQCLLCVNPTLSAWTGGCHAGSGGQSQRLATELAGRNCCRPVHFSGQCPLSNSIQLGTGHHHPTMDLARFLIACHNSIFPSQHLLPLECILFQHWRPICPFPKLRSQRRHSPPNEARGRFADRGQGLDDIAQRATT